MSKEFEVFIEDPAFEDTDATVVVELTQDLEITGLDNLAEVTAELDNLTATADRLEQDIKQAEALVEEAEQYKNEAGVSADEAATSASQASTSASQASTSASQASGFKDDTALLKSQADSAKLAAQAAQGAAETAQGLSEDAQLASEAARDQTITLKSDVQQLKTDTTTIKNQAVSAKDDAEAAELAAAGSASSANTAKLAAQTAQGAAESARDTALLHKNAAAASEAEALAQANRSESEATASQTSAIAAKASEDAALASKNATATLKTETATIRDAAEGFKDDAETAEGNASSSALAASGSASAAAASEAESTRQAGLAADEKTAAVTAKNQAVSAQGAAELAETNAKAAQVAAETAQLAAETAESQAGTYKNQALAYRNEAEGFSDDAFASKNAAAGSASTASTKASEAAASELNAGDSATLAGAAASQANSSKLAAETAKTASEAAQAAAETAQSISETAQAAAELAETNAKTSETNAKTSETNSSGSASSAFTYKEDASESADVAQSWAEYAQNAANQTFVSGGFFDPSSGSEYPDVTGISVDTIYIISLPVRGQTYTFTSGPLLNEPVVSGDQMMYDTPGNTWSLNKTGLSGGAVTGINSSFGGLDQGPIVNLDIDDFGGLTETAINVKLALKADSTELNNYLPLTGGTLTGSLTVDSNLLRVNGVSGQYDSWHQFEAQSSTTATYVTAAPIWRLYMTNESESSKREYIKTRTADEKVYIRGASAMDAQGTQGDSLTRKDYVDGQIKTAPRSWSTAATAGASGWIRIVKLHAIDISERIAIDVVGTNGFGSTDNTVDRFTDRYVLNITGGNRTSGDVDVRVSCTNISPASNGSGISDILVKQSDDGTINIWAATGSYSSYSCMGYSSIPEHPREWDVTALKADNMPTHTIKSEVYRAITDKSEQYISGHKIFDASGEPGLTVGNDHGNPLIIRRNSGANIRVTLEDTSNATADIFFGKTYDKFSIGSSSDISNPDTSYVWFDANGAYVPAGDSQSSYAGALTRYDFVTGLDAQNVKVSGSQTISGNKNLTGSTRLASLQIIPTDGDPWTDGSFRFLNNGNGESYFQFGGETSAGAEDGFGIISKYLSSDPLARLELRADATVIDGYPYTTKVQGSSVNALTRKDYVDGLDGQNVKVTGSQDVDGEKSFKKVIKSQVYVGPALHAENLNANEGTGLYVEPSTPNTYSAPLRIIRTKHGNNDSIVNEILHKQQGGGGGYLVRAVTPNATNEWSYTGHTTHGSIWLDTMRSKIQVSGTPTDDNDLTKKSWVDGQIATTVKLTGNQTISGIKTLTERLKLTSFEGSDAAAPIERLPASVPAGTRSWLAQLRGGLSDTIHWIGAKGGALIFGTGSSNNQVEQYKFITTGLWQRATQFEGTGKSEYLTRRDYVDGLDAENLKKDGSVGMTNSLKIQKSGELINTQTGDVDGTDQYIRMGNATFFWDLKYQGTTSANGGNELIIESGSTGKYWAFDHDGNFEYWDGTKHNQVYQDSYHPQADHADKADASDGDFNVGQNLIVAGSAKINGITINDSSDRTGLLHIKGDTTGWAGIQIENSNSDSKLWSLMADNGTFGVYDDTSSKWYMQVVAGGGVKNYYANTLKFETTSIGTKTYGQHTITGTGSAYLDIIADTDNLDETHNAWIRLVQDGGTVQGSIGLNQENHLYITHQFADGDVRINSGSNGSVLVDGQKVFSDGYHPNADKWTTARTISINGTHTGSTSIDGSANKTITLTPNDQTSPVQKYLYQGGGHYRGFTVLLMEVPLNSDDKKDGAYFQGSVTVQRGSVTSGFRWSSADLSLARGYDSFALDWTRNANSHGIDFGYCEYGGKRYAAMRLNWYGNSQDFKLILSGQMYNSSALNPQIIHTTGDETSGGQGTVANQGIVDTWNAIPSSLDVDSITGKAEYASGSEGNFVVGSGVYFGASHADSGNVRVSTAYSSLTPGTASALCMVGPNNGQVNVVLQANDTSDCFNILSSTTSDTGSKTIDKRSFYVQGWSGNTYAGGNIYANYNQRVFADNYHPNADKWTTARTVTFAGGDVTGSFSINGSSNVSNVNLSLSSSIKRSGSTSVFSTTAVTTINQNYNQVNVLKRTVLDNEIKIDNSIYSVGDMVNIHVTRACNTIITTTAGTVSFVVPDDDEGTSASTVTSVNFSKRFKMSLMKTEANTWDVISVTG